MQFKPTVVKPFSFSLDKRLDERQKYDSKMQRVRKAQEDREKREKERRQKEEEEELKLQRKKLVPKVKICNGYICSYYHIKCKCDNRLWLTSNDIGLTLQIIYTTCIL